MGGDGLNWFTRGSTIICLLDEVETLRTKNGGAHFVKERGNCVKEGPLTKVTLYYVSSTCYGDQQFLFSDPKEDHPPSILND